MRRHRVALVVIAGLSLTMFGLGILTTAFVPELRHGGLDAIGTDSISPGLSDLFDELFRTRNVAMTAAVIFGVNLVTVAILQTTVPSLIIPVVGILITLARAYTWGIIFTPLGESDPSFLVHWVTLLIEGGAYTLVAFAAWVQARMFLQPRRHGIPTHGRGYVHGLLATLNIYTWVVLLLVIGAIYEAVTVIYVLA